MAQTITDDDLDELELSGRGDDHSRHVAMTAIAWAEDPARFVLEEPLTPAHLLLVAAEHLEMLGELDEAWVVANRAAEHPTAAPFEALSTLVSIRLAQGDLTAATELLDGYRRAGAITADLAAQLADVIEASPVVDDEAGAMRLAERWANIALLALERDGGHMTDYRTALGVRYRTRRARGARHDELDDDFVDEFDAAE
ncbi:MAG TPA: hypothetical protein VKZ73_07430 [Microbacterium sp.]|nr:hypothetical protein [Microbacterium sp.]